MEEVRVELAALEMEVTDQATTLINVHEYIGNSLQPRSVQVVTGSRNPDAERMVARAEEARNAVFEAVQALELWVGSLVALQDSL